MDELFQMVVPIDLDIRIDNFEFYPEVQTWAKQQLGYELAKPELSYGHKRQTLTYKFRSERDAMMFKMFWC